MTKRPPRSVGGRRTLCHSPVGRVGWAALSVATCLALVPWVRAVAADDPSRSQAAGTQAASGQVASGPLGAGPAAPAQPAVRQGTESRLERIRDALVDQAMQAPVHVRSNAWVDEDGQFRHVTRMYSDLRARALAELAEEERGRSAQSASPRGAGAESPSGRSVTAVPGHSSSASPKPAGAATRAAAAPVARAPQTSAAPPPPASQTQSQAAAGASPPASAESCTRRTDGLTRFALVRLSARPHDGSHGRALLLQIGDLVRDEFERIARQRPGLKPILLEALPASNYDYRLANDGIFDIPHFLDIEMLSTGTIDRSLRPGEPVGMRIVTVRASLIERSSQRPLFSREFTVYVPGMVPTVGRAELPAELEPGVRAVSAQWWQAAEQALACEPLRVEGFPDSASTIMIPMGSGAGVRVGDRWLLTDEARLPARLLEPGAMAGLQMGEVVSVGRFRSTLRLESKPDRPPGPAIQERGVQWFAFPL